jgi:hypothetical protein
MWSSMANDWPAFLIPKGTLQEKQKQKTKEKLYHSRVS